MRAHRFLSARAVFLAAALLAGCIGGTGTDTENGIVEDKSGPLTGTGTAARVVDSDGKPLAGVSLALHLPTFHPDSSVAKDLVLDSNKSLVTDSQGYARFNLIDPGKYVVEGSREGAVLFFDTLAVSDVKTLTAYTFRARPGSVYQGKVRLASGLQVVLGSVFIRGTSRRSAVDSVGRYDLGTLPVDVGSMSIGLTYRTMAMEARLAEQRVDTSKAMPGVPAVDTVKPVFTCREVSVDSAARLTPGSGTEKSSYSFATATFAAKDTVRLDTARVNAVARSCDSIPGGTVVAVRTVQTLGVVGDFRTGDSATTNLIAVNPANGESIPAAAGLVAPSKLVPLNGCVANPGTVSTTYEVRLQPTGTGSDLHVGDIADQCLK